MKSQFLTELESRDLDDENILLLAPLAYQSEIAGGIIEAPKGFISDLSSTPRVPFVYWWYGNRAHREGVIHDLIYRTPDHELVISPINGQPYLRKFTKSEADSIFLEAMKARGKGFFVRWGMFGGVKFGGFWSWRSGPERFNIIQV